MEKLTEGYEKFIKGKQINPKGGKLFANAINNAATPKKPRSPK